MDNPLTSARFRRRLVPARHDLAARALEGTVEAERFADPEPARVVVAIAPLTSGPEPDAGLDTELLFGERFDVYDVTEGVAWGKSARDGYVGYVPAECLGEPGAEPTHRISALTAQIYPAPDMKTRPIGWLTYGALVAVAEPGERFARLATGGYVACPHLTPLDQPATDWVAEAERMLGSPYLWGGRSTHGLDCSALIQLSRQAAGLETPRDSDMQEATLGETLGGNQPTGRGNLYFWKGHVGVMLDQHRLLHANAHAMAVAIEDIDDARQRIEAQGDGPVTRHARLDSMGSGP